MSRVGSAPGAVLLQLDAGGGVLLVLDRGVVATLALGAGEQNVDAHGLLHNFRHNTSADGAATFADSEAETLFHGDGVNQFNIEGGVIAGHDHFHTFVQADNTGDVGGTEVELRTIAGEERGVTTTFFLGQNVHFSLELLVRGDGLGSGENLTAFHFVTLRAAEQSADVVAGFTLIKQLAEHFHAGAGGLRGGTDTHDFHFVADLDDAAFHTTGYHGTTAGDGEHVFDGHQEGLVGFADRIRDVAVAGIQQFKDALGIFGIGIVAFQSLQSGTADNRDVVAGVAVGAQKFANFHFNQFEQFGVVNHVALVHEHDEVGNADLTGEEDMFTGLGHGTVGSGNNDDRAVHLGSTGNHVLDVVGVAGAVHMGIVTLVGFVFDVGGSNGDTAFLFFRSLVDFVVSDELAALLHGRNLGDGSGQSGFAVVNVADGADVYMRLGTRKFFFTHDGRLPSGCKKDNGFMGQSPHTIQCEMRPSSWTCSAIPIR